MSGGEAPSPGHAIGRGTHAVTEWRERALARPAHGTRAASLLGAALGVSFTLCFVTGLWSHLAQHPPGWFTWPARPSWGYRVTQGVHVASGIAAIPLLLAKLWTVYPHFVSGPPRRLVDAIERLALLPLVGGSLFMLFSGWANISRWYPWKFFFPSAHYQVAWITFGALVVHIALKASTARGALTRPATEAEQLDPERRSALRWAFGSSIALSAITIGQSVPLLRRAVLLAPRRNDISVQGLPINQTAAEAGVTTSANDASWRLVVEVDGAERLSIDLATIEAMPRHTAVLSIACVEGWSASATWTGVRVRDLLDAAGVATDRHVEVRSLEQGGLYATSDLAPPTARHADTLLALELDGERLHIDHGYPVRLIAPNRPGVLQTKWVQRLVAR